MTLTPAVNPDTGTINYIVNENTGVVTVCLMKDLVTAVDFTVTFRAQVKTPPDALCKIIENKIIKYYKKLNELSCFQNLLYQVRVLRNIVQCSQAQA